MGSFIWKMKDDLVLIFKMEDSPNFLEVKLNIFLKWKTISNIFDSGRRPQIFLKMEDDLKYFLNGRRPQISLKMEENLNCFENSNIFENGRRTQIFF